MQFSIRDLLLFPLIALAAPPICEAASAIGFWALPWFVVEWSDTRQWFLDRGYSIDFVCSELTFFWSDIPTILTLVVFALVLFVHRIRICDQIAVITIISLPFVEALQINALSDEFRTRGLGWHYLGTQSLTAVVLAIFIAGYAVARWKVPNPVPTRLRITVSSATIILMVGSAIAVWQYVT